MTEKIIAIDSINPLEIFGVNDANLHLLKSHFPKLKVVARGTEIKVIGTEEQIDDFERKFSLLILHFERFGKLSESDVEDLLETEGDTGVVEPYSGIDVLVHGRHGKIIKARTPNQQRLVDSCRENDLLFAIGPAGTGKTYTA
nr:PhoH family protein [Bacteroidota bacterium]